MLTAERAGRLRLTAFSDWRLSWRKHEASYRRNWSGVDGGDDLVVSEAFLPRRHSRHR